MNGYVVLARIGQPLNYDIIADDYNDDVYIEINDMFSIYDNALKDINITFNNINNPNDDRGILTISFTISINGDTKRTLPFIIYPKDITYSKDIKKPNIRNIFISNDNIYDNINTNLRDDFMSMIRRVGYTDTLKLEFKNKHNGKLSINISDIILRVDNFTTSGDFVYDSISSFTGDDYLSYLLSCNDMSLVMHYNIEYRR